MAERYDTARDADAAEYLPLARAAALVHARLFPQEGVKDVKTLDLLGLAISALIPLYQRDMKSGLVSVLEAGAIERGRFTRGASRLELAGRPPLRFLLVSRGELYPAIERVAADPRLRALLPARADGGGRVLLR